MQESTFFNSQQQGCRTTIHDTLWVSICSIVVMLITPGIGFLYSGFVSKGSMASMLGICFSIFSIVTIIWSTIGYSLVFGESQGGIIGNMALIAMTNLDGFENKCKNKLNEEECYQQSYYMETCGIPEILLLLFHNKFAAMTPVLIIGALSERMILKYCLLFITIWTIVVYCPLSHWVWNTDGWLYKLGVRDFAGGLVVHTASGFSALVSALMFGKRVKFGKSPDVHNFPYVILGIMLVWFGWFGFTGGSSFKIDKVAVLAIVNTNLSASTSLVVWILMDLIKYNKISSIGIALGIVSGLVSITPGAGYIAFNYSFLFGGISSLLCWITVFIKKKYQLYDDLDIFAVHGVSGIWGIIATGLFADRAINPYLPMSGLIPAYQHGERDKSFILYQLIGIVVIPTYCTVVTFLILYIMKKIVKNIRIKSEQEIYFDSINFFDTNIAQTNNVEIIR
jgi:Amt family ammonium transporter